VTLEIMIVVMLGALLHASWNAQIRGSSDRFLDTALVVGAAGVITACWLPFAPLPAVPSWPYLGSSVMIHVAYFSFVALSYDEGGLSFAYPIMRGSAPAFSAVAAALLLKESPSLGGWLGVLLICCGVILLAGDSWRSKSFRPASAAFPVVNAGVIALYTLVDGVGVRLSGHPFSYTGWLFLLTAVLFFPLSLSLKGLRVTGYFRLRWIRGLAGGACTLGSYSLALWAMTHAPIGLVAALRETSVVFGVIIAATFLREHLTPLRCASTLMVTAGAVAIRLS